MKLKIALLFFGRENSKAQVTINVIHYTSTSNSTGPVNVHQLVSGHFNFRSYDNYLIP